MASAGTTAGAGPTFGSLETPDRAILRTARWRTDHPRGTVVLLNGRAEFIEKYQETAAALVPRGFQVFSLDWRNQGLSSRPLENRQKHHLVDFDLLRADLDLFVDRVVLPAAVGPLVLVAHSMGGLVATLHLARHPARYHAAVLSAPMHGIRTGPLPRRVAAVLAGAFCALGLGTAYAFGQGDYNPKRDGRFTADNPITSDPRRYATFHDAYRDRPELRVGGVTFAWVRAALRVSDRVLTREPLGMVATPVLILSAPHDAVVDASLHPRVAGRLPRGAVALFPEARHELLMERDGIRDRVWAETDRFLVGALSG